MNALSILSILAGLAICAGQYAIWFYAPVEKTLGLAQKIFYMHMPMAWWSMISFFVVFVASIMYLVKRRPKWDHLAAAAAEIGVLMSGLALVSGSIWAKASWGVWWTWDPRLSTTLIMWFVYAAYLMLRGSGLGVERMRMVAAVLGVIAFLDVPLVFLSARMWRTVHPAVLASKGGGLTSEMWYTVLINLFGFGLLWLFMLILRTGQARQEEVLNFAAGKGDSL